MEASSKRYYNKRLFTFYQLGGGGKREKGCGIFRILGRDTVDRVSMF